MILGDNPAGHDFVLRDLVLIELSGHAPAKHTPCTPPPPPPPAAAWETGLKISEVFAEGIRNFNFGGRGYMVGGDT